MPIASIPQASTAPRWLQMLRYTTNPLDYMEQGAEQNGDIFNAPVIGNHETILFVSHPRVFNRFFPVTSVLRHRPMPCCSPLWAIVPFFV